MLFRGPMKKLLSEQYGPDFTRNTIKEAHSLYKKLVTEADAIWDDNSMAYNELFALAYDVPYLASGKRILPKTLQEMMR